MDDDTFDEYAVIIYMAVLRRKVRFYLLANSALRQLKKSAYFFVLAKMLWYSAVIQDNLDMFTPALSDRQHKPYQRASGSPGESLIAGNLVGN